MRWITPLSLLIICELIADILAKDWSISKTPWLAIGALGTYLVANTFWLVALSDGSGLARGAVLFSVASGAIAVTLGLFIYKEPLNPVQSAGVVMGLLSVV